VKIFAVLLLFLVGCSSGSKSSNSKEYGRLHLQIGTSLLAQKNYPGALKELLEAERFDPNNAVIQNNLGVAYFVRKELNLSEKHLKQAMAIDGEYSEAKSNYGLLLLEKQEYANALKQFKAVAKDLVYPQPEKARVNIGIAYFGLKNFKEAEESFLGAIDINRNYCSAWTYLGRTLMEQKKFSAAAQRLDQAVSVCKKTDASESDFYAAIAYVKLGDRERAMARLEEIIDYDPAGVFADKSRKLLGSLRNKEQIE
jgi:type IV pilus assembly protein PilF